MVIGCPHFNGNKFLIKYWRVIWSLSPFHSWFFSWTLNPFPNSPFWDFPKFKEAADDNWNVAIKGFWDADCIENCWKRWNCSFWAISPFSTVFSQIFFFNVLRRVYMEEKVKDIYFFHAKDHQLCHKKSIHSSAYDCILILNLDKCR